MKNDDIININYFEQQAKRFSEPTHITSFAEHGQILRIHFSPYEWLKDVLLLAFKDKVILAQLDFQEKCIVKKVYEFPHQSRCTAFSLSPNSSLTVFPNSVIFATGASDHKVRVYSSDLRDDSTCRVLSSHTSYINDVSFDSDNNYLASASDDNTVRVWHANNLTLKATFNLSSPIMVVCWHKNDPGKLLVAEKIGMVKVYNVETEKPILSLDFAKSLSSAHWAPSDCQILGTLQLGELLLWDLAKPCLPQQSSVLFPENGGSIQFSSQGELLAAVNNLDGTLKVVHTITQSEKLTAAVTLPTNVQWHYYFPLVCVGDDTNLCFWKVTSL